MFTTRSLSSTRVFIYHFLRRSMRYHCPMTACLRIDVTDTLQRIEECRAAGRKVSFISYLTLATAKTVEAPPRLNQRLYHGIFRKVLVTFDHITAGLVVGRKEPTGEEILIPLTIRNPHQHSMEEIHELIKNTKTKPLGGLEAYDKLQKVRKLPKFLIGVAQFFMRINPGVADKRFSTYALSSVTAKDTVAIGGHTTANQTTFFPANLRDEVLAVNGAPAVRKVLFIGLSADHFVVDGMDLQRAITTFQTFMENPDTLLGE